MNFRITNDDNRHDIGEIRNKLAEDNHSQGVEYENIHPGIFLKMTAEENLPN